MGPPSTRVCAVLGARSVVTPACVCGTVPGCSALHVPEPMHSSSLAGPGSLMPHPCVEIMEAGIAKSWSTEGF